MNLPITRTSIEVLTVRAVVLAELAKTIKRLADEDRRELDSRMTRGSKVTAFDPRDETAPLGTVSRSNPRPVAVIEDRDEFEAWCRVQYGDQIEAWLEFGPAEEVGAVLARYAPHLVIVHQSVPGEIRELALDRAATEQVPGTKRRPGTPQVTTRATDHARALVSDLLRSPLLPQLEP